MNELNGCPFCKGTELMTAAVVPDGTMDVKWYVVCSGCFAGGPVKDTPEEAEAAWNRRR